MIETEIFGLINGHRTDDKLYRSGEVTLDGLVGVKMSGVVRVICLKDVDKKIEVDFERETVESIGLQFFWMPLKNEGKFGYDDIEKVPPILSLIEQAPGKVLLHCHKGSDRTGTVVACYRAAHGWDVDRALAEMKRYGNAWYNFGMRQAVKDFARKCRARVQKVSSTP